ncbi:MAG: EAL domain-containing protein [Actinomycetota bacterium]
MGVADDSAFEHARRRVRNEIYFDQRRLVDVADGGGIIAIAIGVPYLLWDHVDHTRLIVWGVLLAASTAGWVSTAIRPDTTNVFLRGVRFAWLWGSSLLWASLPWLERSAAEVDLVAWVLVFVVTYGIASDVVFIPQTSGTSLAGIMGPYTISYIIALVLAEQWGPAVAVVLYLGLLVWGGNAWKGITDSLIDKRVESDLRALVDELTGVGSRTAATLAVEQLRASDVEAIACVFLDIDDFKQLNDTYGYPAGDEVLCHVADHIRTVLPDSWKVARFGGDEFVAIGSEAADLTALFTTSATIEANGPRAQIELTLSVGRTILPRAEATAATLFREAGAALRTAKTGGKNQLIDMSPRLRDREGERLALAAALDEALTKQEIVAWGQAVTDLRTGRPVGLELLARWPQPDGSMVMPNDFVPIIEEQGRGPQLGELMVGYAVDFLASLRAEGVADIYATVNISARHLFHRTLAHTVAAMLEAKQIPPSQLVLEVTESQHLPQSSIWRTTAEQLRSIGVGLAIDDFGTGYSSMEQLLSMPFTHLKVDRIITQSFQRPGAPDLAAAIAAMAHGGDMVAIGEGIETEIERRQMIEAGYLYGQGYLFGRPAPLIDLLGQFTATPAPAR